jgi:hypothetical protein
MEEIARVPGFLVGNLCGVCCIGKNKAFKKVRIRYLRRLRSVRRLRKVNG